ncbi:7706_t:CDS:2 [Diversispora eburnea]|uniref:7706_t:CDS:1 n=1 Tax=Diversispora eburnea TaxID=1213867 RepID=A0A9N9AAL8_9GLOM|nr:7706_t:CDS:2 [Diversispora eburnea]
MRIWIVIAIERNGLEGLVHELDWKKAALIIGALMQIAETLQLYEAAKDLTGNKDFTIPASLDIGRNLMLEEVGRWRNKRVRHKHTFTMLIQLHYTSQDEIGKGITCLFAYKSDPKEIFETLQEAIKIERIT